MDRVLLMRLLILVLIFVFHCSTRPIDRQFERRICGHRLSQMLTHLCKYNFYSPDSSTSQRFEQIKASKKRGGKMKGNNILRRISRGLIQECCLKPCSRSEMVKYCAGNLDRNFSNLSALTSLQDKQARRRASLVPILLRLWGDNTNGELRILSQFPPPGVRRSGKKTRDVHQIQFVQKEKSVAPSSDETIRDKLDNVAYNTAEVEEKLASTMEFITEQPLPDVVALTAGTFDGSYLK